MGASIAVSGHMQFDNALAGHFGFSSLKSNKGK